MTVWDFLTSGWQGWFGAEIAVGAAQQWADLETDAPLPLSFALLRHVPQRLAVLSRYPSVSLAH